MDPVSGVDPALQRTLFGAGMVLWGLFATFFPYYAATINRLPYSLTWPREGFEPRYPEIWLARVLGVASFGLGVWTLYEILG
jgi:hypothetical protein